MQCGVGTLFRSVAYSGTGLNLLFHDSDRFVEPKLSKSSTLHRTGLPINIKSEEVIK